MSLWMPLDHQKAPTAVYLQIRQAILDGSLPSGSQLREAHIATEMGISRSPLREALSRLEEDGLVEKVPFRGAFVATVSARTIEEIAAIRVVLEPYVVEQALPRLQDPHWQEVLAILTRLDEASSGEDAAAQIEAHLALHGYFYAHCGNALLAELWQSWESKLRLFFIADHSSFRNPRDVSDVHRALIGVIRGGDPSAIHAAFRRHIHASPGARPREDALPETPPPASG